MNTQWIVVADASRARVLSAGDDAARLLLVHTLEHPASRSRSQELVSDQAGRLEKGGHNRLSAMDPRTDPHEHEAALFAGSLAGLLDDAAARRDYARLTLIAPPHFLGLLRSSISGEVLKRLSATVSKDLTHLDGEALLQHLQARSSK
jgi:protein required for attachment to host cells